MAEIETILTLEEPDIRFRHIKKIAHVARGSLFEILMIVDDDHCDYRVCISKDGEYCCQIIDPMQSRDVEPGSPEELARVDKFLSEAISDIDQNDLSMF